MERGKGCHLDTVAAGLETFENSGVGGQCLLTLLALAGPPRPAYSTGGRVPALQMSQAGVGSPGTTYVLEETLRRRCRAAPTGRCLWVQCVWDLTPLSLSVVEMQRDKTVGRFGMRPNGTGLLSTADLGTAVVFIWKLLGGASRK